MTTDSPLLARNAAPGLKQIPRHIAIIMDGNGRWAKERGFARIRGHEEGAEAVRSCLTGCGELGVEFLTLYAFSSENWKRPLAEVAALMRLLERFLKKETPELMERNVRLQAIGRLDDLPDYCRRELQRAMDATARNTGVTLVLALSYSSRVEIVDAIKNLLRAVAAGQMSVEEINPETLSRYLYTSPYPDPDLLIRTSGEMRLSNFLLWQISYAEIYVTTKYWPDFRKADLIEAVTDYGKRHRRFGGL